MINTSESAHFNNNYNYHNPNGIINPNISLEYKNNSVGNISVIQKNNTNNNMFSNNMININETNVSIKLKRGRKKILFDGVKTELLDKAFLREFKSYIKKTKLLRGIYEEMKTEEKKFWNEFMLNSTPPFTFTIHGERTEFKSYNKCLLNFIFSFTSSRELYEKFIKDREREVVMALINKKFNKRSVDEKTFLYYSYYGRNLHKIYSTQDLDLDFMDLVNEYCHEYEEPKSMSEKSLNFNKKMSKDKVKSYYNSNGSFTKATTISNVSVNSDSKTNGNFNVNRSSTSGSLNKLFATSTCNLSSNCNYNFNYMNIINDLHVPGLNTSYSNLGYSNQLQNHTQQSNENKEFTGGGNFSKNSLMNLSYLNLTTKPTVKQNISYNPMNNLSIVESNNRSMTQSSSENIQNALFKNKRQIRFNSEFK